MPDYPATVGELIEMLKKWNPEEEFEIFVQNNPVNGCEKCVVLAQGINTIRLN